MTGGQRKAYSYRHDPAVPAFPDDRPLVIFDGYCALCSGWAEFVLRRDPEGRYRLYEALARNRLRWFGKRESCDRPSDRCADRFLA